MLDFYYVDKSYIDYLKSIDSKVPDVDYETHHKFVCGIVLDIFGISYYAPISHSTQKFRTSMLILDDKNVPIASIRFSFMFPAPDNVLSKLDFKKIGSTDPYYERILQKEYFFCKSNESAIMEKALEVYKIGTNLEHKLFNRCCDFRKLEGFSLLWQPPEKEGINKQDNSLVIV